MIRRGNAINTSTLAKLATFVLFGLATACGGGGGGGGATGPYTGTLYYVDGNMPNDDGNGLQPATARKFIHTAVADATPPATILVKAGDYRLSSALGTQVKLRQDVSLYGGFNADFSQRDPATYITTIEDRSTAAGDPVTPNRAMEGDGSSVAITSSTIVDGFTIEGSTQAGPSFTAAIVLSNGAAPTIQNNIIHGGSGANLSYGIRDATSSPTIQNNTIHGGSGGSSTAINNLNSSPTVRNNTIFGGSGGASSTGMYTTTSSFVSASPHIDNNIIFTRTGANSFCIVENSAQGQSSSTPSTLLNNDLLNCAVVYTDVERGCPGNADADNNAGTCTLAEMNALTDIPGGVSGNISADPQFVDVDGADNNVGTMDDNDWHLSATSPAGVKAGGLNGRNQTPMWPFTADKDGNARPASGSPWSIGAYEP